MRRGWRFLFALIFLLGLILIPSLCGLCLCGSLVLPLVFLLICGAVQVNEVTLTQTVTILLMFLRLLLLKLRRLLKYRIFPLDAVLLDHVFEPGVIGIFGPSHGPTSGPLALPFLLPLFHSFLGLACPQCMHGRRPRCLPRLRLPTFGVGRV